MRYLGLGVGHLNSASFPDEATAISVTYDNSYVPPSQRESATLPTASSSLLVPPIPDMEVDLPEDDEPGAEEIQDDIEIEVEDEDEDNNFDEDDGYLEDDNFTQYDY